MDGRRAASLEIECLGLPGAGKTRLCRALGAALTGAGTPTRLDLRHRSGPLGRLRTAARVLSLAARRPGYCRRCLGLIGAARPVDRWWLTRTWLKRSAGGRSAEPGVQLTDAGLAQALWSLALRARGEGIPEILNSLAAEAPLAGVILVLEADRERIAERLAQRAFAQSRLERLLSAQDTMLDRGLHLLELVAATLGARPDDRPSIRVLRLRSNDEADLRRNVDSVARLVADA